MKVFIIIVSLLFLSGCNVSELLSDIQINEPTTEPTGDDITQPQVADDVQQDIRPFDMVADNGHYGTMFFHSMNNLLFYDFESMQQVVVCSTLNCTHTGESCEANLGHDIMDLGVAPNKNELIYYRVGTEQDGTPYNRLELFDATNRFISEIASFEGGLQVLGVSDDNIYVVEDNSNYIAVELATGKKTVVFRDSYQPGTMMSTAFSTTSYATGDAIYLLKYEPLNMTGDESGYDDLPENTEVKLYRLDIATGLPEEIYSETVDSFNLPFYRFTEEYMVIATPESVKSFNLTSAEVMEYSELPTAQGEELYAMMPIIFIDGYVTFQAENIEENYEKFYHINLTTGEIFGTKLGYETTVDINFSHTRPLQIVADLGDELIVGISEQSFVDDFDAPDGIFMAVHSFTDTALITEADYFANQPNYRPFNNSTIITAIKSRGEME